MSGRRPPVLKITAKPKGGGDRTDVVCIWRNDDGRLSVSIPRDVEIRIGDEVVTSGKDGTHYLDAYVNEALGPNGHGGQGRRQQAAPAENFPADDAGAFGDDDIPW